MALRSSGRDPGRCGHGFFPGARAANIFRQPAPGIAVMIAGVIVICGLITTVLLLGTDPGHVP
jgi:hypothetical protein